MAAQNLDSHIMFLQVEIRRLTAKREAALLQAQGYITDSLQHGVAFDGRNAALAVMAVSEVEAELRAAKDKLSLLNSLVAG